jgi:DivIVA domain-containing protein
MSEQDATQAEEQTPVIGLAGKRKWGYKVSQVDDFLERAHDLYEQPEPKLTQEEIQLQSFDLEHNGYIIGQVDATLIRLERAVVDKQTQWDILHEGRQAWEAKTRNLALTLQPRAEAELKDRFKAGEKKTASYDKKQVDTLVDQTWAHVSRTLQLPGAPAEEVKGENDVNAPQVTNVIFTQRKGKKGYDEASVDSYLNRVVQVLTRLESIIRISADTDDEANFTPQAADDLGLAASSAVASPSLLSFAPASSADTSVSSSDTADRQGASDDASAAEETAAFDPIQDLMAEQAATKATTTDAGAPVAEDAAAQDADATENGGAQASSSLASLVNTHGKEHEETYPDNTAANAAVEVPPSYAPHTSPAQEPSTSFFDQSASAQPSEQAAAPVREETAAQTAAQTTPSPVPLPNEAEQESTAQAEQESTPEEAEKSDPEEYISSLLNQNSIVQTSSFEIPNLTFPSTESGDTGTEQSDNGTVQSDTGTESADTQESVQKKDSPEGSDNN